MPEKPVESETTSTSESIPETMTIHQIALRSGVPARRIRHYIAKEVLPPPVGRGRASHYTTKHLQLLRSIEAYREGNLGLDEIRERLGDVSIPSPDVAVPLIPGSSSWQRWVIAPGIEIHASANLSADRQRLVRVLLGAARQWAAGDGPLDPRYPEVDQ